MEPVDPTYAQARAHRAIYGGFPVSTSWLVPRESVYVVGGRETVLHPATLMCVQNNGRVPLWTRHMLGVREAERDQRRHR